MGDWRDRMHALESIDSDPIQPQYLMHVIDRLADDDAILTSDSGTIATWAARHFTIRGEREFYLSGNLATMAPGLPYTIANQIAHPGRQCIAFVGDGGLRHADGGVRHGLSLRPPDQGDHQQQRLAGPDHVGAARARLPRVRHSLRATRPTSRRGPRPAAARASGSTRRASSRAPSRRRSPSRARPWSM